MKFCINTTLKNITFWRQEELLHKQYYFKNVSLQSHEVVLVKVQHPYYNHENIQIQISTILSNTSFKTGTIENFCYHYYFNTTYYLIDIIYGKKQLTYFKPPAAFYPCAYTLPHHYYTCDKPTAFKAAALMCVYTGLSEMCTLNQLI